MSDDLLNISERPAASVKLVGGRLCLDFINTVEFRDGKTFKQERLHDIADLLVWARHVGILTDVEASSAISLYALRPDIGEEQFLRAFRLREAIHAIVSALIRRTEPHTGLMNLLNGELTEAHRNRILSASGTAVDWTWQSGISPVDRVLWPIALSVSELLTDGNHARLHECSSERCGWIFEDTSKNHTRRWCSMEDCGNQAKVRRYRKRHAKIETGDMLKKNDISPAKR